MKRSGLLSILGLLALTGLAAADSFSGTYMATLPNRAEILQLHQDGTASITLSDEVTSGAGGFTFSDSFGSWKVTGPRTLTARFVNLNFDITGPPTYTGAAVVDYTFQFAPTFQTFSASCQGKIYPTGTDPFASGAVPYVTFDCAYLNGFSTSGCRCRRSGQGQGQAPRLPSSLSPVNCRAGGCRSGTGGRSRSR